ncbi:aminodeoxychorismate/anthranilate synthase component II [Alginatibacterium sediminis]|uniref:Aminodeoxychorismate/anthranilate synthase component II n=1 Tax=Alginatibacterium sediminis TaxID=2164068 RepID=A0A420EL55_9ALTE|nr:aminodeoxychorismate/anthranilate synthase component II [Alginatibacterium sediminis]RKF21334.1 aminodeoxychorismate/anthranilate synthase component II [Alginatibacterium sediminis]
MLLIIDNYDSFTYNLSQYFAQLGQDIEVLRNDAVSIEQIEAMAPSSIVISPGPCSPDEAGISLSVIDQFKNQVPILGVCLGHQCIAQYFGAKIVRANAPLHGKVRPVHHQQIGVFQGLESPFKVTRYHSLIVDETSLPECLEVTARSDTGEIMGLRHRDLPIQGVQFHPESILSEYGLDLLKTFLAS